MGILGTSVEIVNGIWGIGSDIYKATKEEISKEIDDETEIRVRKLIGDKLSSDSIDYKQVYRTQRLQVKKDAKEMAGKGALMLVGFGLLF